MFEELRIAEPIKYALSKAVSEKRYLMLIYFTAGTNKPLKRSHGHLQLAVFVRASNRLAVFVHIAEKLPKKRMRILLYFVRMRQALKSVISGKCSMKSV